VLRGRPGHHGRRRPLSRLGLASAGGAEAVRTPIRFFLGLGSRYSYLAATRIADTAPSPLFRPLAGRPAGQGAPLAPCPSFTSMLRRDNPTVPFGS
jgi:hypothetical protein